MNDKLIEILRKEQNNFIPKRNLLIASNVSVEIIEENRVGDGLKIYGIEVRQKDGEYRMLYDVLRDCINVLNKIKIICGDVEYEKHKDIISCLLFGKQHSNTINNYI